MSHFDEAAHLARLQALYIRFYGLPSIDPYINVLVQIGVLKQALRELEEDKEQLGRALLQESRAAQERAGRRTREQVLDAQPAHTNPGPPPPRLQQSQLEKYVYRHLVEGQENDVHDVEEDENARVKSRSEATTVEGDSDEDDSDPTMMMQ
jgi:hypothetical protein